MRMAHDFAAARAAAQHCPELTGHGEARGPRPEERAELLTAWHRDLARALADDLSPLLSDDRLEVTIDEPDQLTGAEALERIGALAANSLLRVGAGGGAGGETALLSFDFATALALTDRSFGGEGRTADNAPETLPRSAALMVEEAATMIAQTMTRASYADARGEVMIRSENAARLKPFAPDAACLMFTLVIANQQGCTWRASLVVTAERMDRLLPGAARTPRPRADRRPATGTAAPFANVPLSLHAVLAEFDLSLARLQTLSPGDSIPLTMGRQVPLMVGEQVLAYGSIGTADDRMAIRLTRIPVPAFAEGAVS